MVNFTKQNVVFKITNLVILLPVFIKLQNIKNFVVLPTNIFRLFLLTICYISNMVDF